MHGLRHFIQAFTCLAVLLSGNEAIEEASEGGSTCYKQELSDYRDLFREAFAIKQDLVDEEDVDIYINCMSLSGNQRLETAIVSARYSDASTLVLDFACAADALLALESERSFNESENVSCFKCADSPTGDACVTPCAEKCERCYGVADNCVCAVYVYEVQDVEEAVDALTFREEDEDEEIEHTIEETITELSSCKDECDGTFRVSEHGNLRICYACGIQFCTECEGASGHEECTKCLPHTVLYHEGEGECLFGFLAEVLEVAEEQEQEVEEEERARNESRIELAVTLPVVSVVVVLFFIFMSFIAHKRYPHIGETGRTRHRNKPESVPEPDISIDDSVFRPQPTVRLR